MFYIAVGPTYDFYVNNCRAICHSTPNKVYSYDFDRNILNFLMKAFELHLNTLLLYSENENVISSSVLEWLKRPINYCKNFCSGTGLPIR